MTYKLKRYLVSGGNGFIGAHLVRHLSLQGHHVVSVDPTGDTNLKNVKCNAYECDVCDWDKLDWCLKEEESFDSFIHLAYVNGTRRFYEEPERVLKVAVEGMTNALKFSKYRGIREFVLASSSEVYQTPSIIPTPENVPLVIPDVMEPRYSYGGGKIISELMTINFGRDAKFFDRVMIFRPHNVYGPGVTKEHVTGAFISKMKPYVNGRMPSLRIIGDGKDSRSYIYIDDLIAGIDTILRNGKHLNVYNIGNPRETTVLELATIISDLLNVKIDSYEFTEGHSGATSRRCPDIKKLASLGFQPRVSLEEGLRQTIPWVKG